MCQGGLGGIERESSPFLLLADVNHKMVQWRLNQTVSPSHLFDHQSDSARSPERGRSLTPQDVKRFPQLFAQNAKGT